MSLSQRFFSEAFRDMQRAMTAFDQTFYNTARRSNGLLLNQNGPLFRYNPATDMAETADAYELKAELPGYDKKNIQIELADSRTLVLSGSTVQEQKEEEVSSPPVPPQDAAVVVSEGDVKANPETKKKPQDQLVEAKKEEECKPQYWVKERVLSGSFSRSFSFPKPINPDAIKASFENGILKVVVPKTAENQAQKIDIE